MSPHYLQQREERGVSQLALMAGARDIPSPLGWVSHIPHHTFQKLHQRCREPKEGGSPTLSGREPLLVGQGNQQWALSHVNQAQIP